MPHLGSPRAYLAWEAGEFGTGPFNFIRENLLTLEAISGGYGSLFNYVKNLPILSIQELLPIYDYLREDSTLQLRQYPNNYPRNIFLEILNEQLLVDRLDGLDVTNIIADAGQQSTIKSFRIVNQQFLDGKWEHGYPENYGVPFTDQGLEVGPGDNTVPEDSNSNFSNAEEIIIQSDHDGIVTDAQKAIIKELTGVEPTQEVRLNFFQKYLMIRIFSPADFVVIAPDGKRLGKDFASGQVLEEISSAFYSGFNTNVEFAVIPDPIDGQYQIELQGTGDGSYRLVTSYIDEQTDIDNEFYGAISTIQELEFIFDYNSQNQNPVSELEIIYSLNDFRDDIEKAYQLGWISKESVRGQFIHQADSLDKKLGIIIEPHARANVIGNSLNVIKNIANAHLKSSSINQLAYDMIISSIDYLLNNL
ncbi:hypothetical protein C4553_03550 [Candidatus Parcubacteria bacterium]|nr:MAG: hypothetical protein C4553_03550 [Candidatus Parcubacteria bacterium]